MKSERKGDNDVQRLTARAGMTRRNNRKSWMAIFMWAFAND